jgi:superfamily II DNA or RNA helicase
MIASHLHSMLQFAEWASTFDEGTLQRGADYVRRRRVITLDFTAGEKDSGCSLDGIIRGSERQPYRCRIDIQAREDRLTPDTACSCPVGRDCKHAAAMLLLAANLPPQAWPGTTQMPQVTRRPAAAPGRQPDLSRWPAWLRHLKAQAVPDLAAVEPTRQFGVLLRGEPQGQLLVNPVWLRPGKGRRPSMVDPQPLQLHERAGPLPTPPGGWPEAIASALAILLQDQHTRIGGRCWTMIHAAHQEQALETLLTHCPVYFERGSVPLQRGPSLPLELRWHGQPDGSQKLLAGIDSTEAALLLRGSGLWYVLPGTRIYGRIEGIPALLDSVAQTPVVLPEQVDALRKELLLHPGPTPIPLPDLRPPVQIVQVKPQPVLHLRVIELSVGQPRKGQRRPMVLGCARLVFDYDGHVLAPDPDVDGIPIRIMHGVQVLEIVRDGSAESAAQEQLDRVGMVEVGLYAREQGLRRLPLDQNDFVLQPDERKPPLAADGWKPTLDTLADAGFRFTFDAGFPRDELVDVDDWHADLQASGNRWFDVSLGVDVGGERIDLLPVLRRLLADPGFPRHPLKGERKNASWRVLLDERRSANLPLTRLRALIEPLLEWLEGDGDLRLHRSQAPLLAALDEHLHWRGGDLLRAHLDKLENLGRSTGAPDGFKATLRPYQRDGLAWLDFLGASGLGGILADDMGLGKTVQVLAHILGEKQRGRLQQPALVVAPTSLVGNWQAEAARFAPALRVLVIHGAARADRYDEIASHDLVITTYPLLPRDRGQLLEQRFALLVLDEAQAIKNVNSQAARVVREIPATRRLAMTGTPLENHLGELWAQFDAVEPGLLGSQRQFAKLYRTPIEKHADVDRQQRLNRRIGPLLLRRRKDDVLTDLPAKTEIVRTLELEGDQRALYETLRLAQHERVRQAVRERGMAQSGIIVLDALLKLRQACCDPRLVKLASAKKITTSAKLDALLDLIDGLLDEGRRVLLFSQFTSMLALIEAALVRRGITHQLLTGQTPASARSALIRRFQQGDVPIFLISLKAGGVGLNLTAADTVIHYDPWWNPAAEAQATDRAHRIGQDKPVFVYRLICAGTVEEKIQAMQSRKAELARAVLEGGGATTQLRFDEKDLAELFAPL